MYKGCVPLQLQKLAQAISIALQSVALQAVD